MDIDEQQMIDAFMDSLSMDSSFVYKLKYFVYFMFDLYKKSLYNPEHRIFILKKGLEIFQKRELSKHFEELVSALYLEYASNRSRHDGDNTLMGQHFINSLFSGQPDHMG